MTNDHNTSHMDDNSKNVNNDIKIDKWKLMTVPHNGYCLPCNETVTMYIKGTIHISKLLIHLLLLNWWQIPKLMMDKMAGILRIE